MIVCSQVFCNILELSSALGKPQPLSANPEVEKGFCGGISSSQFEAAVSALFFYRARFLPLLRSRSTSLLHCQGNPSRHSGSAFRHAQALQAAVFYPCFSCNLLHDSYGAQFFLRKLKDKECSRKFQGSPLILLQGSALQISCETDPYEMREKSVVPS